MRMLFTRMQLHSRNSKEQKTNDFYDDFSRFMTVEVHLKSVKRLNDMENKTIFDYWGFDYFWLKSHFIDDFWLIIVSLVKC